MKTSDSRSSSSPLEKKGEDIIYFISNGVLNNQEIDNIDADYFDTIKQLQIVFNFSTYVIFDIENNILKYYDYNDDLIDDLTIKFNMFNRKLKLDKINENNS
jgi:hypothetical protein